MQPCAGRQAEQVDAAGRDALNDLAWTDVEAGGAQLVMQLSVDQVNLAQIGLAWVASDVLAT
jgi:hypothetical protein